MRVTLPVDPGYKTASEAATIELLRMKTSIPVPRLLTCDWSRDNPIGFEWMLMERLPGITLDDAWVKMTWPSKIGLVNFMVDVYAQMFRTRSNAIGNVFRTSDLKKSSPHKPSRPLSPGYMLGKVVSMPFFWDKHIIQDIARGPFSSSEQWLRTLLSLTKLDCEAIIANGSDEDEVEEAEKILGLALQLLELIPKFISSEGEGNTTEWCCLHHDDLHEKNVLVDPYFGHVTGILDWECVHYVPLWEACQLPAFLQGADRTKEPLHKEYQLADGTTNAGFLLDTREFENTLLRAQFLRRMAEVEPSWTDIYHASGEKVDFCYSVLYCDGVFSFKRIQKWLDNRATGGEYYSLIQARWG